MRPAILLPGENDPVLSRPDELIVGNNISEHTAPVLVCLPYFPTDSSLSINNADRPRLSTALWRKRRRLARSWYADESDLLTVARPDRFAVAIHARIEIAHCPGREIINTDEAVVAACVDECQLRSVGRPMKRVASALCLHQRGGFVGAVDLYRPDVSLGNINERVAFR